MIRGLGLADLEWTVRVLLAVPAAARPAVLDQMLHTARAATHYHARTGHAHPQHGCGTLMAVAGQRPMAPRPPCLTADYLRCLALVAQRIGDQIA